MNNPIRQFCLVSELGIDHQIKAWKLIAIGIAQHLQQEASKRQQSQTSSTSSSQFTNPVLRQTDQTYHALTGQSIVTQSCVTKSSFNFKSSPAVSDKSSSSGSPFANVTMDQFIKAFHHREDHKVYKDFCVLMQIALTLIIHTTSNERAFSVVHQIMTNLRNRITVPLLDALMRIKLWSTPLTDADLDEMVGYWYQLKTRRVKISGSSSK